MQQTIDFLQWNAAGLNEPLELTIDNIGYCIDQMKKSNLIWVTQT